MYTARHVTRYCTATATFDMSLVRCGNVVSWMQYSSGFSDVAQAQRFVLLRDGITQSVPFLRQMPVRFGT